MGAHMPPGQGAPGDPGGRSLLRSWVQSLAPSPPGISTAPGPPLASIPSAVASGNNHASYSPGGEHRKVGPRFNPAQPPATSIPPAQSPAFPNPPTPSKGKQAITPFREDFPLPSSPATTSDDYPLFS